MISRFLTMGWTYKGKSITELSDMPEGTFGFIYKITNGKTSMEKNQILTDEEINEGLVLSCQARAQSQEVSLDFDEI